MSLMVLTRTEVHRCCTNLPPTYAINYENPPGDAHSCVRALTNLYKFLPTQLSLPQRVINTRAGSDHLESGSLGLRLTELQLMGSDAIQRTEC